MPTPDEERARELGRIVERRRLALGLSKDKAAELGLMATVTWTRVEKGQDVRALSLSGVDRALGWPDGSCADYLDGGNVPRPIVGGSEDAARYVAAPGQREERGISDDELLDRIGQTLSDLAEIIERRRSGGGP